MKKGFWKYGVGWGIGLWFIGYVLGIVLFAIVPQNMIGWVITPIGILITLWVLIKIVKLESFKDYALLGVIWAIIAVVFDYIFIVLLFKSTGYYKLDVYVYYALTLVLPLLIGFYKLRE
ncbi:MAG: hypothetical protein ABSC49_03705 [Candidatus Microgenomates bacterium]|jgi:hypothetical protein